MYMYITTCIDCFSLLIAISLFIAGTMYFNAKHGCQCWNIVGKHSKDSNTVVFTQIDNNKRQTDALFRANAYPKHQRAITPLVDLPNVDMIQDFVVSDPLHLLELGVMKRLLIAWRIGNMLCARWCDNKASEITDYLLSMTTPLEINRSTRSLLLFRMWKRQEFRNFLSYFGFVVIRQHLADSHFNHFMKLFCAVRMASSKKYVWKHSKIIEALLIDFRG